MTKEHNLVFEDPQEQHSGNYTFIANNTAAEKRKSIWISALKRDIQPLTKEGCPIPTSALSLRARF